MEKESPELEHLKKRLFQKNSDELFLLREIMREVGGYEQLMNLPIVAYNLIAESIISERKLKAHSKH